MGRSNLYATNLSRLKNMAHLFTFLLLTTRIEYAALEKQVLNKVKKKYECVLVTN